MTHLFKKHGAIIISLITAIAILATAWLAKGTAYENAWLFILAVGSIITAFFEWYSKKKEADKR